MRVGVLGGKETPVLARELAQDKVERVGRHFRKVGFARQRVGIGVEQAHLRLVVRHLLKVGHVPEGVYRVAMKAA